MTPISPSHYKDGLSSDGDFHMNIIRSWGRFISIMGIAILLRRHLYIETGQRILKQYSRCVCISAPRTFNKWYNDDIKLSFNLWPLGDVIAILKMQFAMRIERISTSCETALRWIPQRHIWLWVIIGWGYVLWPLLLTWFNFNPSMDK